MSNITREKPTEKTLGELIANRYPDFTVDYGKAEMSTDISHGIEIETYDNTKHGHGITVNIYPFVEWTDGQYKPCHYWGDKYYLVLKNR